MEADVTYVNEGYTQQYDQLETEKLKQMEEEAFIKIIIGEYPADYFDTFIEAWYAEGGRELTDQANKIAEKQWNGNNGKDIRKIPEYIHLLNKQLNKYKKIYMDMENLTLLKWVILYYYSW